MIKKLLLGSLFFIVLLITVSCTGIIYPRQAPARPAPLPPPPIGVRADIRIFYDELSPYGDWFWLEEYGWVWSPYRVPVGWRPYSDGYWIYTDYGLTWISNWEWGWAAFHYGRWQYDSIYGWIWIPGTEWAPAWVVWRYGNGWIGWAPLPSQVHWRAGIGIDFGGIDIDVIIQPFWWCFVEEQRVFYAGKKLHIVPQSRNVTYVKLTKHVTNYVVVEKKIVNKSIDVKGIEKATRKTVPHYTIIDVDSVSRSHRTIRGKEIQLFRPTLAEAPEGSEPKTARKKILMKPPAEEEATPARPVERKAEQQEAEQRAQERAEMEKRQEIEKKRLEQQHDAKRDELERIQKRETRRPPQQITSQELKKRQDEERKALKEQIQREKELLKKKHERERKEKEEKGKPEKKQKEAQE